FKHFQKYTFFRFFPGALLVVILGIGLQLFFRYFPAVDVTVNEGHLVNLPMAKSLPEFISFFTFPDFTYLRNVEVYVTALTIGVVASIESLLSVEAVDKLDPYKRITPTSRELKAQGLGN